MTTLHTKNLKLVKREPSYGPQHARHIVCTVYAHLMRYGDKVWKTLRRPKYILAYKQSLKLDQREQSYRPVHARHIACTVQAHLIRYGTQTWEP